MKLVLSSWISSWLVLRDSSRNIKKLFVRWWTLAIVWNERHELNTKLFFFFARTENFFFVSFTSCLKKLKTTRSRQIYWSVLANVLELQNGDVCVLKYIFFYNSLCWPSSVILACDFVFFQFHISTQKTYISCFKQCTCSMIYQYVCCSDLCVYWITMCLNSILWNSIE